MLEIGCKTSPKIQGEIPLLDALKNYSKKDISCFDVPGHVKSNGVEILNEYFTKEVMDMDINSSPMMDNLSNPQHIIKKAQKLLANAYSSDEAFFITNGTTGAIQAMILSCIDPGDKILLPRNIHKSVINALILSGGIPIFIQPQFDYDLGISMNISCDDVTKIISEHKDIKAIFLLNPTYYGNCCDLEKIINICHVNNILVLVDEAHGAHFPFHKNLPQNASSLGADMVATSIHKTGGALTQASALLVNTKNIDLSKIRRSINMIQSTSASYLLMASIDGARNNLVLNGEEQLSKAINLATYARLKLNKIKGIYIKTNDELIHNEYIDETKLCINVSKLNLTGFDVYDLLYQKFDIQVELADINNILALISLGTTKRDIDRLIHAISDISKLYFKNISNKDIKIKQIHPKVIMSPREAFYSNQESVCIKDSINKISAESIMAYPPGIPIIAPGEMITKEIIDYIELLKDSNAYITDMKDNTLKTILVIK